MVLSSLEKQWDSGAAGRLEFKESEIYSLHLDNLGPLLFYISDIWVTSLFNSHILTDYFHVSIFHSRN